MKNSIVELPESLEKYRDSIEKTIKPYIKIKFQKQRNMLWESKLGGDPYIEIGMEYPKASNGEYLRLLAQINFEEIPPIEAFPQKGILQFFILPDDMYGLDFDNPCVQDTFRVIYIPHVVKSEENLIKDFSFLGDLEEDWYMPFANEGKMNFSLEYMPIPWDDYRFNDVYKDMWLTDEEDDDYMEKLNADGSRIGGYPFFTQADPRDSEDLNNHDTLLLQLDCEKECDLMFGDGGVANFFISEEDLKKLDFTKVLYNWDCC
ncbi:YwqG family protein [Clostridium thailandense]|uniref:YwqG family protein n=1 Tax=Clostridium thailandense TaxID=2794346 RepID=UPI003988CBE3